MADLQPMAAPAFQHYPKDFEAATQLMTLEEAGAYARLYNACWTQPALPFDMARLAVIARTTPAKMRKLWPALAGLFVVGDGAVRHPHIEAEREKQAATRAQRKLAAEVRWERERAAHTPSQPDAPPPGHAQGDARAYADACARALHEDMHDASGGDAFRASTPAAGEETTTTTTTAGARERARPGTGHDPAADFPRVVEALRTSPDFPDLLERFLARVAGDPRTYLVACQTALGTGAPTEQALTPGQLAWTVNQWLSNLDTGSEGTVHAGRFAGYLASAAEHARKLRDRTRPVLRGGVAGDAPRDPARAPRRGPDGKPVEDPVEAARVAERRRRAGLVEARATKGRGYWRDRMQREAAAAGVPWIDYAFDHLDEPDELPADATPRPPADAPVAA